VKKARSLLSSSRARDDSVVPGDGGTTGRVTTFSSRPVDDDAEHQATEAFAQHQQPPPRLIDPPRLLNKHEVKALIGRSYDWIWRAASRGAFPRGRYVGQGLCWLSTEIEDWLANLPKQKFKGDAP
jgi:predicted DNA-binding transcriptional regulator AlpA